jgi:Xaa-Pro aminopeptidase
MTVTDGLYSVLKYFIYLIVIIYLLLMIYLIFLLEPGYYEDGNFGIRLENVLVVKDANTKFNFGDKGYLAFEHITWVSQEY